jgi:hypothetical protein
MYVACIPLHKVSQANKTNHTGSILLPRIIRRERTIHRIPELHNTSR